MNAAEQANGDDLLAGWVERQLLESRRRGRGGAQPRLGLRFAFYGRRHAPMDAGRGRRSPLFRQSVERGVTFWETANVYQGGTSEEFVGRANTRFSPVS